MTNAQVLAQMGQDLYSISYLHFQKLNIISSQVIAHIVSSISDFCTAPKRFSVHWICSVKGSRVNITRSHTKCLHL